jgi:hypothetical protein
MIQALSTFLGIVDQIFEFRVQDKTSPDKTSQDIISPDKTSPDITSPPYLKNGQKLTGLTCNFKMKLAM